MISSLTPIYIISFLPYIICIPISLCGINLLQKNRHEMYIMKRNSSVVIGWNYALIFTMCASCFTHSSIITNHHLCRMFAFSLFYIGWWCCFLFLITTNWILFFKSKWTYYTLQYEWHELINSDIAALEKENNWFLRYHYKYGKTKYMLKVFAIFCITMSIIDVMAPIISISSGYDPNVIRIGNLLQIITLLPPIIFYAVIVCKRLKMNDTLFIEWEYSMYSKILSVTGVVWFGMLAMRAKTAETGGIIAEHIIGITLFPAVTIAYFMLSFVSTFMVIKKNKNRFQYESMRKAKKSNITFNMVLAHKTALNMFVKHLSKQLNMECLLSYIEFAQYQQYLLSKESDKINNNNTTELILNAPQSEIIVVVSNSCSSVVDTVQSDDESMREYKMMAYRLYKKYITEDCEFEINISAEDREMITHLLQNKELLLSRNEMSVNDLYCLFQNVKDEMYGLLEFVFFRFIHTDEFGAVTKLFVLDN